jgi:hypothetical protein
MLASDRREGSVKARAFASIVVAGVVIAGVAGCTFVTPIATQDINDVTDGIDVTVGHVKLLNATVITDDGKDGNLVASAYNDSDQSIDLTLQYDTDGKRTVDIELAPNSATPIGFGKKGQLFMPSIGTKAGGLLPLYVQYGDEQGKQVKVPVLDGSEEQYSTLTPTPVPAPRSTGTATPSPTDSATPAPSGTPAP